MTEGILTAEEQADILNECLHRMYEIGVHTGDEELQDLAIKARSTASILWDYDIQSDVNELLDDLDESNPH